MNDYRIVIYRLNRQPSVITYSTLALALVGFRLQRKMNLYCTQRGGPEIGHSSMVLLDVYGEVIQSDSSEPQA